ncbi:unnamed protein product [Amoebophrya sp. A25]|nr:unnamed protein product [Amoebophrya sp. A25]|eukprot:GSA25T00025375001.1
MGGLLAAFAFSALVSEGPTDVERVASGRHVLIESSEDTIRVLDQVRVVIQCFMSFVYVDMWLTSSANRKCFMVFAGAITKECDTFHYALYLLLFVIPLYVFKYFGICVLFFFAIFVPVFCIAQMNVMLVTIQGLGNIANHIELGVYENHDDWVSHQVGKGGWRRKAAAFFVDPKRFLSLPKEIIRLRLAKGRENWRWSDFKHKNGSSTSTSNPSRGARHEDSYEPSGGDELKRKNTMDRLEEDEVVKRNNTALGGAVGVL